MCFNLKLLNCARQLHEQAAGREETNVGRIIRNSEFVIKIKKTLVVGWLQAHFK